MNCVVLKGRFSNDPDVRYGQTGTCVARFNLAVDRRYKKEGEPSADFINCIAFGKTGEFIEKYFQKGSQICLNGRIQTGSYERDGQKVYFTQVIAENVEFCDSKRSNGETGNYSPNTKKSDTEPQSEFDDVSDIDDLPFD